MKSRITPAERSRRAHVRLRVLRHFDEVTRNVSKTCRHFGISRSQFYFWRERYQDQGERGLVERKRGPKVSPFRTPPEVEALVLKVRQERQYGALRICLFMRRYCDVYVSPPTISRILREHRMPRVSQKRYRPGPTRRRELRVPGQSVQVDVKHVKLSSGRLYQFTAFDEATRYRVLKIYNHNSIRSAIDFVDELRRRLPIAIQTIRTDNGSEVGTDFTWHLHDLGIKHKHIPPGCPEANGKVERSHRTDEDEFYRRFTFTGPSELRAPARLGARIQPSPAPSGSQGQDARRGPLRASDQSPSACPAFGLIITRGAAPGGPKLAG